VESSGRNNINRGFQLRISDQAIVARSYQNQFVDHRALIITRL